MPWFTDVGSLASDANSWDITGMRQRTEKLEQRLARVEKEVAEIKAALSGKQIQPWYRQIVGSFACDPAFAEIIRLGRLIRRGKLKG